MGAASVQEIEAAASLEDAGLACSYAALTAGSDVPGHAGLSRDCLGRSRHVAALCDNWRHCREQEIVLSDPIPLEPQRVFAAQLRDLRAQCGKPTQQELADAMNCGRTMVSEMLGGRRFPAWTHAWALVTACARSDCKELEERWYGRWLLASRQLDALRYGQKFPGPADLPAVPDAGSGSHVQGGFSLEEVTTSSVPAAWYRDNPEFYRAAAQYVRRARAEIRLTYIRQYPPTDFTTPAPAEYFTAVISWAGSQDGGQRSVRRIIGLPYRDGAPDRTMLTWIRRHRDETRDILNYEANVMPWHADGDGLNVACIDDNVALVAFSGYGRQNLNGFSVENANFTSYFIRYFDQLWSSLQSLETYLHRIDTGHLA